MAAVPLILAEEDIERGGKEQPEHDIQNDFAYNNSVHNASINIRMGIYRILQDFETNICLLQCYSLNLQIYQHNCL